MSPETCYCEQQSSQYPIFPSQARDQYFTRVARNETKYEKILDAADFARRENCSFVRLNDAFRKTLLKAAKKERIMGSYEKLQFFRGEGGRLMASEKLIKIYVLQPIQ